MRKPPIEPINRAYPDCTKPADGVMTTSPTTVAEQRRGMEIKPISCALILLMIASRVIQIIILDAADTFVLTIANEAIPNREKLSDCNSLNHHLPLALSAEPPFNPIQPTQSRPVPRIANGRLV